MGMAAILVTWPGPFQQTFVPPFHRGSIWNLTGPVVSEEEMFKRVRTTTYDGGPPFLGAYQMSLRLRWAQKQKRLEKGYIRQTGTNSITARETGNCPLTIKWFGTGMLKHPNEPDMKTDWHEPQHKAIAFRWLGLEFFCLLLGPPGFNCWFSFAPVFQWCCSILKGSPGVGRNTLCLSSPHLFSS